MSQILAISFDRVGIVAAVHQIVEIRGQPRGDGGERNGYPRLRRGRPASQEATRRSAPYQEAAEMRASDRGRLGHDVVGAPPVKRPGG